MDRKVTSRMSSRRSLHSCGVRFRIASLYWGTVIHYVIPNKEFITGQMLNWTLSDKTNRVVINVGIAYGSDVDKAKQLLGMT